MTKKTLQDLHETLTGVLLEAINEGVPVKDEKTGEVTKAPPPAAILNVARQFLKDNNIEAIATNTNPIGQLSQVLPFQVEGIEDERKYHS